MCADLVTGNVKHRFKALPFGHPLITVGQHLSCWFMRLDRCRAEAHYEIVTRNYTFKHVYLVVAPGYVRL